MSASLKSSGMTPEDWKQARILLIHLGLSDKGARNLIAVAWRVPMDGLQILINAALKARAARL